MADFRAISGVSATLQTLLHDRMENPVVVTIAPPDVTVTDVTGSRVNLYLYDVKENAALKNQEIRGHGHPGAYGHPPLWLDLFYLLTPHGSLEGTPDADLESQQVLGDAMRVLHDYAIITPDLPIVRASVGTVGDPILDGTLVNDFERVKITLDPTSLDDLLKIWTALPQSNFRRSATYRVSVVQIESSQPSPMAAPVRERRVILALLERPEITRVYRTPASPTEPSGDARAAVGQELTIEGRNFSALKTSVRLGGLEEIVVTPDTDERLRITIPDDEYPIDADHPAPRPISDEDRLQPGPQTVTVLTERETEGVAGGLDHGDVFAGQRAFASNQSVFMLVPEISQIAPLLGPDPTVLVVEGQRLYLDSLSTFVLLGDRPLPPLAPVPPSGPVRTATEIQVGVTGLDPGVYGVRVRVNGAESLRDDLTFEVTT